MSVRMFPDGEGACIGPETFQPRLNEKFYDYMDTFVTMCIDDPLFFGWNKKH